MLYSSAITFQFKLKQGREGERKEAPFPSSHRPPRAFYFFIIAIFFGIPGRCGSLCGGERTHSQNPILCLREKGKRQGNLAQEKAVF